MEDQSSIVELKDGPAAPYAGLRGFELVSWALRAGPECVPDLGSMQKQYFERVSIRSGVSWPEGFFASTIEDLMPHRFDSGQTD